MSEYDRDKFLNEVWEALDLGPLRTITDDTGTSFEIMNGAGDVVFSYSGTSSPPKPRPVRGGIRFAPRHRT